MKSFGTEIDKLSPSTLEIFKAIFPNINLHEPGAFLQLTFVTFGFILAGFAALFYPLAVRGMRGRLVK